jgi:cobalt-zinc-cadmium efflux system outer membrane protein
MIRHCLAAALLASCVPSRSAVFDPVDHEVKRRLGVEVTWREPDDERTAKSIQQLLQKPIDLDAAVRIALVGNRHLQARFEDLGVAASEVASATVLPPTQIDVDRKFGLHGGGNETEVVVIQDVLSLIQIGQRRGVATAELAAVRARAVAATIDLARRVEIAFDDAVAAQQQLELVQTAFAAADAAATLVERQFAAGNTTDLALARERAERERVRVETVRAEQELEQARARLGAMLGVTAEQRTWTTISRLPDPPKTAAALDNLELVAQSASLDVVALRADAEAAISRHRYAMVRAFLPELGFGVAAARRESSDWEVGPAVRIALPLFDQQQGPRARALAQERRATNELAATRADVHSEVIAVRSRARQAFAEARQVLDVVLPLRQKVLDETVLHYNAMNATTFELLMARRDVIDVGRQYIDALRRYWDAMAEVKALQRGARAGAQMEMP